MDKNKIGPLGFLQAAGGSVADVKEAVPALERRVMDLRNGDAPYRAPRDASEICIWAQGRGSPVDGTEWGFQNEKAGGCVGEAARLPL